MQKIEDNIFIYTRTWEIFHSVKIIGLCYLEGSNWLSKIEKLLELCDISRNVISAIIVNSDDSLQINFVNKYIRHMCKNKINLILIYLYRNKVFIE